MIRATFRIYYRSKEKNLSKKDIAPLRKKIVKMIEKKFGGKLVGKLK